MPNWHVWHGQWIDWLEGEGVSRSTAKRFMRLAEIQISQVVCFGSVDEAVEVQIGIWMGDWAMTKSDLVTAIR